VLPKATAERCKNFSPGLRPRSGRNPGNINLKQMHPSGVQGFLAPRWGADSLNLTNHARKPWVNKTQTTLCKALSARDVLYKNYFGGCVGRLRLR
jgi:hypothetical protein